VKDTNAQENVGKQFQEQALKPKMQVGECLVLELQLACNHLMATFQILTRRGRRSKKVSQMMAGHQTKQRISLEEKQRGPRRFFYWHVGRCQ
jgi:hypothetical protein